MTEERSEEVQRSKGEWSDLAEKIKESTKRRKEEAEPGNGVDVAVVECEKIIGSVSNGAVYDDISGAVLDLRLAREAREEEMKTYHQRKVYSKVPLQQCYDETGKEPIGTRWLTRTKGTRRILSTGAGW